VTAAADSIAAAIAAAQTAAAADAVDFRDAMALCATACDVVVAAERTLASQPSLSVIGGLDATATQLSVNAQANPLLNAGWLHYQSSLTAATAAQAAYLADEALPANQAAPPAPPGPGPSPTPPGPAPAPPAAPATGMPTWAKVALIVAGTATVAGVGYWLYKRS
jgi:hypothetical protein